MFLLSQRQLGCGIASLLLLNLSVWWFLFQDSANTTVSPASTTGSTGLVSEMAEKSSFPQAFKTGQRPYSVSPDDAVDVFRTFMLQQPPPAKVPVFAEAKVGHHYSQVGQDAAIDDILKQKRNGFFIEVGAYDGVSLSNSLFFELNRGWTGLLIEANPRAYRELIQKDRHAWTTGACISLSNQVELNVDFLAHGMLGGYKTDRFTAGGALDEESKTNPYVYSVKANCFPLGVMLDAIGVRKVDMFSLDVEGAELAVLKSIDFSTYEISLIVVEENGNGHALTEFMQSKGYRVHSYVGGSDIIFALPDLMAGANS